MFSKIWIRSFNMYSNNKEFIKNINFPVCNQCVYFIPSTNPSTYNMDKCMKFGEKNIITGKLTFEYAEKCRDDPLKCGIDGGYFKPLMMTPLNLQKT